jgi:hypothetical protein
MDGQFVISFFRTSYFLFAFFLSFQAVNKLLLQIY